MNKLKWNGPPTILDMSIRHVSKDSVQLHANGKSYKFTTKKKKKKIANIQ